MDVLAMAQLPAGDIVVWLAVGLAVGLTGRRLLGGGQGDLSDVALALMGSFFGGIVYVTIDGPLAYYASFLTSVGGAFVFLMVQEGHAPPTA